MGRRSLKRFTLPARARRRAASLARLPWRYTRATRRIFSKSPRSFWWRRSRFTSSKNATARRWRSASSPQRIAARLERSSASCRLCGDATLMRTISMTVRANNLALVDLLHDTFVSPATQVDHRDVAGLLVAGKVVEIQSPRRMRQLAIGANRAREFEGQNHRLDLLLSTQNSLSIRLLILAVVHLRAWTHERVPTRSAFRSTTRAARDRKLDRLLSNPTPFAALHPLDRIATA